MTADEAKKINDTSLEGLIERAKNRANIANVDQNDNIRREENIELRDLLNQLSDAISDLQTRLAAAEKDQNEALNELDAVYGALGTADAEGAPPAVDTIVDLQAELCQVQGERDAANARAEAAEAALASMPKNGNDLPPRQGVL